MKNLMKAIFGVQQEVGTIGKDANNPFHKSKYATLEHVWEVVKPRLLKYNLVVLQPAINTPEGAGCKTIITHIESGESVESTLVLPLPEKGLGAQGVGSCISYARRYALTAALGLVVGDEDDDGEASLGRTAPAKNGAGKATNRGPAPKAADAPKGESKAEAATETPKAAEPAKDAPTPKERKAAIFAYLQSDGSFSEPDIRSTIEKVLGRKVNPTGDVLLKSIVELERLELWVTKLKALTGGNIAEWMKNNPNLAAIDT